jgi:hypothetical protein
MKSLLLSLVAFAIAPSQQRPIVARTSSPGDIFARFCELDAQGSQLTPDGWEKVASLFVNPGDPPRQRIIVSDGGDPLRPSVEAGKIAVGREYIQYGKIDLPQLRFTAVNGLPPNVKVRTGTYMVKVSVSSGVEEWRIEGPVPDPVVNVDAAISFVTKLRDATADPIIRANASRTLASLKYFR